LTYSVAPSTAIQYPRAFPLDEQVIDPSLLSAVVEAITAAQQDVVDAVGIVHDAVLYDDTDANATFSETDGLYTETQYTEGLYTEDSVDQGFGDEAVIEIEGPKEEEYDSYDEDGEEGDSGRLAYSRQLHSESLDFQQREC